MLKRIMTILLCVLLVLLVAVAGYVAYVFIDYHRVPDFQALEITRQADENAKVEAGVTYSAVTYNIGFCAYTPDFSFFMDGGASSWAKSPESVRACAEGVGQVLDMQDVDFVFCEEVDRNSTRSYHIDQMDIINGHMSGYDRMFAVNYDSPFLFYPLTQPHGKSLSGLALYSRYPVHDGIRRSLPIAESVQRLIDLDRCYMKARTDMADGRALVMYTIHMTAYSSDATVRDNQLKMLISDMTEEYEAGNAVICGGDFNLEVRSMLVNENTPEWAHPLDRSALGQMADAWDILPEEVRESGCGSCRDSGVVYTPGVTQEWTLDTFLVSPNVTVETVETLDLGYTFSDHNPVKITFHIN